MNNRSTIFIAFLLEVYTARFNNSLSSIRNVEEIGAQCQLNQFLQGNICYGKCNSDLDCHYSCQQCIGNQVNSCISCNILTKRILIDSKCMCLESYYELEQQTTCQKCNKSCLTCQGVSESDCLSCNNKSIFTDNRCLCKPGYYIDNNNIECTQCDFTCEYCFNSSFDGCIKCNQSSLRQLENNECKCPIGYYTQVGIQQCQKCNEICNSCNQYDSCLSCKEDKILTMNTCICQIGYVLLYFGHLNQCQKCHDQCQTCFGIQTYECSTCKPNSTLQSDNTCYCDDGYYLYNNDCLICDSICQTCVYSSTNCQSCIFGYVLQSNNICCHISNVLIDNQCSCSDGFYLDNLGICEACPNNCMKCDEYSICSECIDKQFIGTSCNQNCLVINCQECDLNGICTRCLSNFQKNISGDCICVSGEYFLDSTNTICIQCSEQIDKCSQCDITGCLFCEVGYFINSGFCIKCMNNCLSCHLLTQCDICNDGYFGTQCDICDASCKNCSGSLFNECIECKDNTIQNDIQISLGSKSIFQCECDYQFYFDSNFNCQPCDSKCNTCDGGSNFDCLDCFLSQNRINLAKNCMCDKTNNYVDLGDDLCYLINCGFGCADCQMNGLLYVCHTCHNGDTNRVNDPLQNCPCNEGYYEVSQKNCKQCPFQCSTCNLDISNQPYCTACSENRDINDNCNCLIGYYISGPTCLKCPETCLYCLAIDKCIQCQQNFVLKNGICICPIRNFAKRSSCNCNQGYYLHLETQKCLPCHPKCKQCELTSTNCIQCFDNYYKPPDCICASGFYELDIKCIPCTNNCHLCKSDLECLDCPNHLNLINNKCICQTGYFNYPENSDCNLCSLQCLECKYHQDNCVKCKYNRISPQLCICPDGTYEIDLNSPCSNCNSRCSTCDLNSNNCLKCSLNRIDPPLCNCKIGYFEDEDIICQQCNSRCRLCETTSENCLTCKLSSTIPPNCDCLDEYYYDISNGCIKCHQLCLTCNGFDEYHCLTCDNTRFLQLNNTQCECQTNYYFQDDICQICSIDIEVCQPKICGNGIKQRNEECDDGNIDNRDGCSKDCKLEMDYYCQLVPNLQIHSSIFISICTRCTQQCKVCNSNRCLQCHTGYFLTKSFECNKCDKHCKECSGPFQQDCLSCIKGIDYGFAQKCAFCEETIGLYTNGLHCVSLCGDGIKKTDEKCDDGNTLNYDGCSNLCQIEQDWGCQQLQINTLSICQKLNLSIASLEFQRVKDFYQSSRIGLIQFSKPMILFNSSIIQLWKQQIVNQTDHIDYDINSTTHYNQDGHLESISMEIILHKSIDFIQYQIDFSNYIIHDAIDQYPLKTSLLQVDLLKYKQLSTQTLSTTKASRQFGSTVLFVLGGIAVIGLLMGSLEFYWNVLDNLQILSYITYINVNFPYMHNQFLDIFQFARFEFTNDFFKIDIINGLDYQQNKDYPLIVERDVEYNLVVNLSSILVLWITPLILLFISKFNLFMIQKLLINRFQNINRNQKVTSLKFLGYKVISFIHFISLKYCSSFYYTIILRIYLSSLYDLNFSIFTSTYCWLWNQTPTLVDQVSFIIAMSLLLFQFAILFILSASLKASSYQISSKLYGQYFGSLYEGIKQNKQMNRQIQFLQPLRKIMFMGALLLFFDTAIYQISLLISIQIMSSLIVISLNPYKNILETIKGITQDVGLSLSLSLILFYYAQDQFQITDQDTIEKLSYIHVGIYTIMLSTSLVIDLYQQFKIITNKYKYLQQISRMCQKKNLNQNPESNRDLFIDLSQQNEIKLKSNQFCFTNLRIQ